MPTAEKVEAVKEIQDKLSRCSIAISTKFSNISVSDMTKLRKELRGKGLDYKVVKNNLARIAAKEAGKEGLDKIIEGPTAIAFSYSEPTVAAKTLAQYIQTSKVNLTILGGLLGKDVLTAGQVQDLARVPPREVLLAQLASQIISPLYTLAYALNAPIAALA
ncbi:MAG: 50S ribosomal protein L10, partial [Chloroflexi bacterium]|nr:50S ribosomal protein L10 [Chloroflexota bacterium]